MFCKNLKVLWITRSSAVGIYFRTKNILSWKIILCFKIPGFQTFLFFELASYINKSVNVDKSAKLEIFKWRCSQLNKRHKTKVFYNINNAFFEIKNLLIFLTAVSRINL